MTRRPSTELSDDDPGTAGEGERDAAPGRGRDAHGDRVHGHPGGRIDQELRAMLTAMVVGGLMPIMNTTITTISMPTLIAVFRSTASVMQWTMTAYLLALAVVIPLVGWAQSRLGGRTLWLAGLGVFMAGSLGCALSGGVAMLIASRAVQGAAAGILMTLMQTLPMQEAKRRRLPDLAGLMATVSVPVAIGPILGPVIGGLILNWLSWRWLFLINLPIGAISLGLAVPALRDDRAENTNVPLDVPGLLSLSTGLALLLLGLSDVARDGGPAHTDFLLPLAAGIALMALFALRPRSHDPRRALVDVSLLRIRSLRSSCEAAFLVGACTYAAQFLLPLYWQDLRHQGVLEAALLLTPQGVGSLLSRIVAGTLTDRLGPRNLSILGFLVTALATLPLCLAGPGTSDLWLSLVLLVRGAALGILLIPVLTVAYVDVGEDAVPHATILTRMSQQVGASTGTALAAVALESPLAAGIDATQAFRIAFTATIVLTLAGLPAAIRLPQRD